jgi:hypothetical protein
LLLDDRLPQQEKAEMYEEKALRKCSVSITEMYGSEQAE